MNENKNPILKASFLSRLFYCWLNNFLKKSSNVRDEDVYDILHEESSRYQCEKLEKRWKEELKATKGENMKGMLTRALLKTYGPHVFLWSVVFAIQEGFKILQPFLIGKLIEHFLKMKQDHSRDYTPAYLYALALCISTIAPIFILHHYFLATFKSAMFMRVSCCSLLYKKSLRLGIGSASSTAVAQLINLMSNDVSRFDLAISVLPFLIIGPVELVVVTLILWFYIGWGSLCGSLVLLLFIPFSAFLARIFSKLRAQTTKLTDARLGLLGELLRGVQYVKMCCWEEMMEKRINETRRKEIGRILLSSYARGANLAGSFYSGKVIILAALACYVLTGNQVSAQVVFVAMSMYNPVKFSMTLCFPMAMQLGAESLVTIERIQNFLMSKELQKSIREAPLETQISPSLSLHNVSVSWDHLEAPLLTGVSLEMSGNDLVLVVGAVGVGKTSLLLNILGEIESTEGALKTSGKLAYVSQQAWVLNGSIRENILMGTSMEQKRYDDVIKCCCLDQDLAGMPEGDLTRVGDRGMGLSGGQKARVSLCRAVYQDAQVYLLDDPLSAVDAAVSLQLFERCINGHLKGKLRLLVTHHIQYLQYANKILYLNQQQGHSYGTYEELRAAGINVLEALESSGKEALLSDVESECNVEKTTPLPRETEKGSLIDITASSQSLSMSSLHITHKPQDATEDDHLGSNVAISSFYKYFTAGSGVVACLLLLLLNVVTQAVFLLADWWLVRWCKAVETHETSFNSSSFATLHDDFISSTNNTPTMINSTILPPTSTTPTFITSTFITSASTTPIHHSGWYLGVFGLFCVSVVLLSLLRALAAFKLLTTSNHQLHTSMLFHLIRSPLSFFVTKPSGRIMDRFSKDMGHVDEIMTFYMVDLIQLLFLVLGVFVMLAIMNYWVLVIILPMFVVFFFLRRYFLSSFGAVKRIEAKTKGPVFSYINTTFLGLLTIRSHGAEVVFTENFERLQDTHTASFSLLLVLGRWFAIRLELLCSVVISVVTFAALIASEKMDGSEVGLSLSYSISTLWLFQWVVRQSTEIESMMTHVERIMDYTNLPIEEHFQDAATSKASKRLKTIHSRNTKDHDTLPHDASHQPLVVKVHSPEVVMPDVWPKEGAIEFRGVSLTYESSSSRTLKDLNFSIRPGEKIGIVGRTGAGKSSLVNTIFKLVSFEGQVLVDGRDINTVSTATVRRCISIIPQEQVILSGSLRSNLDPELKHTDSNVWDSLRKVKLDTVFQKEGLDQPVDESGGNLSIGQQQLLCMARALLQNNKILLIDEATANVDRQTDSFVQSSLREHFSSLTVLTIAHRLITVIDCDKIMLMEEGRIVEFDSPHKLLMNQHGAFHRLAKQLGHEEMTRLMNIVCHRQ